jgi:WD40 repeat protein
LVFTNGTAIDVWDWQATAKTITHSTSFGSGSNKRFALKWSPDGTALASLVVELPYNPLSEVGLATIEVWNTENWLLDFAVSEKFLVDTQFTINSLLDWNPNGQPLVLFAGNQARLQDDDIFIETPVTAFVIDLNTQTTIQSMPLSGSDAYSVAWQPNGDLIAVGTDAFVSLYNLSAQQFIRSHPIGYDIRALDWSPDGRYVMGDTAVIDAISQEVLGYFAVSGELVSTQWSPDGLHILTAAVDGALRVEDPYLIPDFVPADDLEDMAPGP